MLTSKIVSNGEESRPSLHFAPMAALRTFNAATSMPVIELKRILVDISPKQDIQGWCAKE